MLCCCDAYAGLTCRRSAAERHVGYHELNRALAARFVRLPSLACLGRRSSTNVRRDGDVDQGDGGRVRDAHALRAACL
jgi:hypothetical protein